MNLLQQGEVFELKIGHNVFAVRKQIFDWDDGSQKNNVEIKIGETYHQTRSWQKGDKGFDPDFVVKERAKQNAPDYLGAKGLVSCPQIILKSWDSSIVAGKYVVLFTEYSGGGTASDGPYPNGWRVHCKQIIDDKIIGFNINFYQTGAFCGSIKEEIPVIDNVEIGYIILK